MYFTGYHGTTKARGHEILEERGFTSSKGNKEWLGTGIYFYDEYRDAFKWSERIVGNIEEITVLHVLIDIDENCVLDLDSEKGKEYCRTVVKILDNYFSYLVDGTAQENQCIISNFIWKVCKEIQMLIASFASEKTPFVMLKDVREKRREFCLKNNKYVEGIQKIERRN